MVASDRDMVPFGRACEFVDSMRKRFYEGLDCEVLSVPDSLGRRLSADVAACVGSPPFNISTMDGYALNSGEGYPLRITGEVFAGQGLKKLGPGEAVYITTGGVLPEGADAVLQVENAAVKGDTLSGPAVSPWTNVMRAGADFGKGETILKKGTVVSPSAICILTAAAVEAVKVYEKPRVGVLSTGDEIKNGMTRDSNAPMVCAMLKTWGCDAESLGVAPDAAPETKAMLDDAVARYDAVVTIGGVSVGKKDFIISTVSKEGDVVFHGYRVRPGKPLLVSYYHDKPVFSLPGKPTGAFTAMELIVKRFFLGERPRPSLPASLSRDVRLLPDGFEYVVYVQLEGGEAVPMGYEGSPLKLFPGPAYGVSLVSSSPRPIVSDGFFVAHEGLKKGQKVNVSLLL
jgi:molybdenum cofactor synthesis domain-containing protein